MQGAKIRNKLTQDPSEKREPYDSLYFVAYLICEGVKEVTRAKDVRSSLCRICTSCKPQNPEDDYKRGERGVKGNRESTRREGRTEPGKLDNDHRRECSISKEIRNQSAGEKHESAAVAKILCSGTHSTGNVSIVITAVAIAKSTKFATFLASDWRYAAIPSTIIENTMERTSNPR